MLAEIGSVDRVPDYIAGVKAGELRLMGFGHRVYKSFDPRARILKQIADQVFEVTGANPLLDIALALEKTALGDDYFVTHKLYTNVDFYSGIIYQAMGFPVQMFPVLFAIGRTPGWLAQWEEGIQDSEQKITRPGSSTSAHQNVTSTCAARGLARDAEPDGTVTGLEEAGWPAGTGSPRSGSWRSPPTPRDHACHVMVDITNRRVVGLTRGRTRGLVRPG
jgi:citrate synthase